MTLAWALALAADSLLRACLPPCHVNVAACGPCLRARAWLLVDPESAWRSLPMDPPWACGPGCSWAWLADPAATCGRAWHQPLQAGCLGNCGLPRVDSARCEPGLLLADLAGAASTLKLLAWAQQDSPLVCLGVYEPCPQVPSSVDPRRGFNFLWAHLMGPTPCGNGL